MLDGPSVVAAFKSCGVTHAVWIPDSELGKWESALDGDSELSLIRVCREGEAIGVAMGLTWAANGRSCSCNAPACSKAGNALRTVFTTCGFPSSYNRCPQLVRARGRKNDDNCPVFAEPIMQAWRIPYVLFERSHVAEDLVAAYRQAEAEGRAGAVLLAE